jgi:serine/threonine-protein kinase RsbW
MRLLARVFRLRRETGCVIQSRLDQLSCVDRMTGKIARKLRLDRDQQDNLGIAVTEAVGNAIVHGNRSDPEKKVTIRFQVEGDRVHVFVSDQGRGFNPESLPDPRLPDNLMKENGRGIFILKSLMDEVHFDFTPAGTTLHMVMRKRDKGNHEGQSEGAVQAEAH